MATTSLARQLEQLRATTVEPQKLSVAQQGPNILSGVQLSGEQLTLLAKDAFEKICDICPSVAHFKNAIFQGDQDDFENDDSDDAMDDDGEPENSNLEDLLFLLSPHILSKPTQYLLQYLVAKLKIHKKHPETLFFVALPYNSYAIFGKIVECLPIRETTSEQEDHPRWVQHFRLACHPATTVGLHRHLACDRGFFNLLCSSMLRLMNKHLPKFGSDEGVDYNKIIYFFVSSVISSLNLCNSVSEHQTFDLMKVIVAGLKCNMSDQNSAECRALASIVYAYLIPRVQVKTKVCAKLLKVLSKMSKKQPRSTDTLTLLAILYRCQRSSILGHKSQVLAQMLKHDEVMADVMENADRKEEDEKQFAKRLQKAVALLLDDVFDSGSLMEIGKLLQMIFLSMGQCSPTSETAEILITSVSKTLVEYNQRMKKIKKAVAKNPDDESARADKVYVEEAVMLCHKILDSLRKNYVEEFSRKSKLNEGKDIFIMDNEDELPTPEQISVKRLIMDNKFVQDLMNEKKLNGINGKVHLSNFSQEDVKVNGKNIKAIFGLVQPDFLLRHIQPQKLVPLLVRVLRLYENKYQVLAPIMKFATSDAFLGDVEVRKEFEEHEIDLLLFIFPKLFSTNEKIRPIVFDGIKKVAKHESSNSPLSALVSKLKLNPEISTSKLEAQINALVDFELLSCTLDKVFACQMHQDPSLLSIVLLLGTSLMQNFRNKEKGVSVLQKLLALTMLAIERLNILPVKTEDENQPPKSIDNSAEAIEMSFKLKAVPIFVFESIVETMKLLPKFCSDPKLQLESCIQTLVLGSSLKSVGLDSAAQKSFEIFDGKDWQILLAKISALKVRKQIFSINNVEFDSEKLESHFFRAQLYCSKQVSSNFEKDKLASLLPYILSALTTDNKKVRKATLKCFEDVLGQATKKVKSAAYLPLLQHMVNHKAEIMSNAANLADVMSEFSAVESNELVLDNLLTLVIACESSEILVQLCPLLSTLSSANSMEKISKFGLKLLSVTEQTQESGESLAVILTTFLPAILGHAADPSCWDFIKQSVASHSWIISHNNLDKSVAVLALESLYSATKKLSDNSIIEKLFNLLIDLSGNCESSDVLMMARKIAGVVKGLTSKMFLAKLGSVWGEKLVRDQSEGRFSVRSASQVDLDKNWRMTLFLLEIGLDRLENDAPSSLITLLKPMGMLLKEALDQTDQHDNSYQLDLLLSSTLFIMDKVGSNSLNETSINPELMVRCIRTCQNPNTKATALLILAKSSAANPEYILHNSIPIFTFMGTHFLKIDAKHSFDVACQAIDVIIPHIQEVCLAKHAVNGPKKMAETSLNILHTFADASVDMPHPHRVKTFMFKLLSRLGDREYMWILTMLLLKKLDTNKAKKSGQTVEDKLEQMRELYSMFGCSTQIHAVHKMLSNLREDSNEMKQIFGGPKAAPVGGQPDPEWVRSSNVLRVYSMAFINHLLTSRYFVDQVAKRLQEVETIEEERTLMYRQLEDLLEAAIINTDHFEQLVKCGNSRRQFVACCEKILEAILSLLPLEVFVKLLSSMLLNQRNSVRRKMLEVFNAKLQQSQDIVLDEAALTSLLEPLVQLATGEGESNPFNQQLALLCLRSFGRAMGSVSPGPFNLVCKKLSDKKFLESLDNQAVKAATLLCLTELFQSLGPHSVPLLQPFIAWMLELMADSSIVKDNTVVLNSIILSVQKCLDNFGGFLNPYYKTFVIATCRLMRINDDVDNVGGTSDDDRRSLATKNRLRHLCTTISRSVPTHKLVDIAAQCYDELLTDSSSQCVIALSLIIRDNLAQLDKARALAISGPCLRLFQHLFKYRQSDVVRSNDLSKSIEGVESHFIETFLTLMLKLSLDDFKPIFYRLFNLSYGGGEGEDIEGMTTMFHITKSVAQKLKTLFAFICETLVQKTTSILNSYSKEEFKIMSNIDKTSESKIVDLVSHMLDALTVVFTHNQVESLLIKNYEEHVNAVLSHVEAPLAEANKEVVLKKIRECLGQLAVSTEDETQWKYLNYQVLLCIRNSDLKVRLFVLDVVDLFLDKKGENYLTVLPDSVPLLAEALDDDNSRVEAKCRKLIKKMEEIFGHSVESYFE